MKKEKKNKEIIRKAHYLMRGYFRVAKRTKKQINKFIDEFKEEVLKKGKVPIEVKYKELTGQPISFDRVETYPKYTFVVYCVAFYAGKKKARIIAGKEKEIKVPEKVFHFKESKTK